MDGRNIACVAAAALVGSLLLTATATLAQPGRPVVIEKHVSPLTRVVSFADLSLATKTGRNQLYTRVSDAVDQVCPALDDDGFTYDQMGCKDFAWDGARPQMRNAIRAAKSGSAMAMTIAITATDK